MTKTLKIAKREYKAAVRTKGFIIGLLLFPVLMGGSFIAMAVLRGQVDTTDKVVAVIDHSGFIADAVIRAAEQRNAGEVLDEGTGKKVKPAYLFEVVDPAGQDPAELRLDLSGQIRRGRYHAFLEIPGDIVHPTDGGKTPSVSYHAENAALDDLRGWLGNPINNAVRRQRLLDAGIDPDSMKGLFQWAQVEGMGLLTRDSATGEVKDAVRSSEIQAIAAPMAIAFLMFMMVMMGAVPLLQTVMEEKTQRIAEVVLGSASPFEFMFGKVLGGVGVSLTAAAVYIFGSLFVIGQMGGMGYVPLRVIPWFFAFLLLAIVMQGALLAAVGSACNDAKDAQNLTFPAMLPIMIPMFVMFPVLKEPMSAFATGMSFIPPFTPMLMLLRLSTPGGIPAWQPWVGLVGVLLCTILAVWAGGRIFRVGILMQGQPPKIGRILHWAIKG